MTRQIRLTSRWLMCRVQQASKAPKCLRSSGPPRRVTPSKHRASRRLPPWRYGPCPASSFDRRRDSWKMRVRPSANYMITTGRGFSKPYGRWAVYMRRSVPAWPHAGAKATRRHQRFDRVDDPLLHWILSSMRVCISTNASQSVSAEQGSLLSLLYMS